LIWRERLLRLSFIVRMRFGYFVFRPDQEIYKSGRKFVDFLKSYKRVRRDILYNIVWLFLDFAGSYIKQRME